MESIRKEQTTGNATGIKNIVRSNPVIPKPKVIPKPIVKEPLKKENITTKIDNLTKMLTEKEAIEITKKEKKDWKIPFKWKKTFNKSIKKSLVEKVLCFFINNKGELEAPVLLPIINGNIIVYKYTIHKIEPTDILTLVHKKKFYKLLIYRLFDRKAVSISDYKDVKERGDSTENDEVLIKAMLTAKASQISKQQMGKGALIIGGLVIVGVVIWIFSRG